MTYSLWSRGRLLGHSDLRWGGPDDHGCRCGFFECAEGAQSLVDIVAAVEKAESALDDAPDDKTAAADLVAAKDRAATIDLELHASDGRVLKTSEIEIRDTIYVASHVERPFDDAEFIEELSEDPDLEDDLLERELFEQQLEAELANATLLDSFDDDDTPPYSLDDDPTRYVLTVTFVNPADYPPIDRE